MVRQAREAADLGGRLMRRALMALRAERDVLYGNQSGQGYALSMAGRLRGHPIGDWAALPDPVAASFAPCARPSRAGGSRRGAVVVMPTAPPHWLGHRQGSARVCLKRLVRWGTGRIAAARRVGHRLRGVQSGLLQDEHIAVRVAEDGLGSPWLPLWRAVELDTGSVQPLVFGIEVIAGQHEPAQ